jgi:hypothetical protein
VPGKCEKCEVMAIVIVNFTVFRDLLKEAVSSFENSVLVYQTALRHIAWNGKFGRLISERSDEIHNGSEDTHNCFSYCYSNLVL